MHDIPVTGPITAVPGIPAGRGQADIHAITNCGGLVARGL
jgi:hypothetical protein